MRGTATTCEEPMLWIVQRSRPKFPGYDQPRDTKRRTEWAYRHWNWFQSAGRGCCCCSTTPCAAALPARARRAAERARRIPRIRGVCPKNLQFNSRKIDTSVEHVTVPLLDGRRRVKQPRHVSQNAAIVFAVATHQLERQKLGHSGFHRPSERILVNSKSTRTGYAAIALLTANQQVKV